MGPVETEQGHHRECADRARCRHADGRGRRGRRPDRGARASIPMKPGGRFRLRNVEGEITVTGVDGDDLTIRATKRASRRGGDDDALDRVEVEIEERGNRVTVETDNPRAPAFLPGVAAESARRRPAGQAETVRGGGLPGGNTSGCRRDHRVVRRRRDRRSRGRRDACRDSQRGGAAHFTGEAGRSRVVRPDRPDGQRPHRYREGPSAAAGGEVLQRRGGATRVESRRVEGGDGLWSGDP